MLISQVSQMIKVSAPAVKFGISPFGVWRNASKDPQLGSATRAGINTYDDLYGDVRGWLEKGWIDYVAPQLYWNIGFAIADYEVLLKWWQGNCFNRNLYAGHAAYKINNSPEPAWKNPGEIPGQIRMNRSTPGVQGSIFYNTNSLIKNPLHVIDSLKNTYYTAPALLPEMPYLNIPSAAAPELSPGALPAVMLPSLRKAGRSLARESAVVSGRLCSSFRKVTGPFRLGTCTGVISASNNPAAWAAEKRVCERSAQAS